MSRLFTRIYLHFLGVLVVMAVGAMVIGSLFFRGPVLHGLAEKLSRHAARLVAERINDPKRLSSILNHLATDFEVDMTVRDTSLALVVVAGPELPPPSPNDFERAKKNPIVLSRMSNFSTATPIVDDSTGALLGILEIAPRRHFGGFFSPLRPLLGIAGILLLVGLATAPLARRLSRPVDRLIDATRRFGEGDLSYRIPLPPWCTRAPGAPPIGRHRRVDQMMALMIAWNEMAERIEGLVGGHRELLANVSHELRSPLTRLRMALELLPATAESEVRIRDLESDLGELERLIEDVLATSRLETGFRPRAEPVDVTALFAQLKERAGLDPLLAGKELIVEPVPEALTLSADTKLLKRALWNLLENAGKYGAPPIQLGVEAGNGLAIFRVCDRGAGIPEAEREKVTAPFYRGDKARTPGAGGFGLGLTLARRIAETHGGSLRIEDAAPGCRIVLSLPLTAAP